MKRFKNFLNEAVEELPQKKEIDVDSLVSAEKSTVATEMYEAAGILIGMEGSKLTSEKLTNIMNKNEFSPIAKKWIEDFLKVHSNKEALDALLNWMVLIGGAVADVHSEVFKDFIHKNIKKYYDNSPSTFQIATAEKANAADVVLITKGESSTLLDTFKEIAKLSDTEQSLRVKTNKKGLITLLDKNEKEIVSFYQISLKKAFKKARVGRVTTFINKNYAGGRSLGSPTQARDFTTKTEELQLEGFFSDIFSKFKDVVSSGFKNFAGWVNKKYTKISEMISKLTVKFSNKIIKKNRGMKSISKVLSMTSLDESTSFLGEKKSSNIEVTKKLLSEFETIQTEFIKKDEINKTHKQNVALLEQLNSEYAVENRKVPPIVMLPNDNAGIVDMVSIKKKIKKVLESKEGDILTKSDLYVALKIGMSYSANVAIFAILKSIQKNISQYENLSQSLFAFAAEIESEAKFGNTSLPLVIVYGGENKKAIVLGKRSDYTRDSFKDLSKTGKEYDDFPVAIIRVQKASAGKTQQLYNVIHFKIVSSFKKVNEKPEPVYLMFELIADQSRSFTLKIEGNKYQDKKAAMS